MIGICLGDVTGVGPEVALKALAGEAAHDRQRYLIIGDGRVVEAVNERLGTGLAFTDYRAGDSQSRFQILNPANENLSLELSPGSPAAARAAVAWLEAGAQACLRHELNAIVTAPVSKEAIIRCGIPFVGQTEHLATMAGADRIAMMLLGTDDRGRWLRVVLATTHLPLKLVASELTQAKVELAIERAAGAGRDLALPRARIGVCGLNPHAGEGGEFGDEEITIIRPAVERMRMQGVDVHGPFAADTLFHQAYHGAYDLVVAMYHDQGLAPLKLVAFDNGVNWTLGLPFIRTSPDHGTAFDIAGKGVANAASMTAALRLAKQLAAAKS
jgi:4-hydroxythreonine-4-phosphate dehydrogenase